MPVPDSSADLENSETAPLLAPELPSQRLINSCGKINKRICLLSIAGISAALLIMTGIVGYFVVIPNAIQSAIHGTGSHVTMVRIVSIKPEAVQVQLDLNMPLKQVSPLDSSMQESQMILSSVKESVFYPEIPIGSLQLPTIHIPANTHQLVVNLSTTVENINAAWVSHFFRQSVFHGLPLTHLKATSRPQVSISHLGSWPAILLREYSLDPNSLIA